MAINYGGLEETGFAGEELNHIYSYVSQNPLYWYDPYGLAKSKKPDGFGSSGGAEHTSGQRPSTTGTHEGGAATKRQDRGREKGDNSRDAPRKRPKNWRGVWPPRGFPPVINPCVLDPSICNPYWPLDPPISSLDVPLACKI